MSDLVWIAVPNRLLDGPDAAATGLRRPAIVRVVVVPRLDGSHLAGEGLADWPERLTDWLAFSLWTSIDGHNTQAEVEPVLYDPVARREVWATVFRDEAATLFKPKAPLRLPDDVTEQYTNARRIGHGYREASDILADPGRGSADVASYIQDWVAEPRPQPARKPYVPSETLDFRRTFGLLREHPEVLRDLGLVFELLIEGDELYRAGSGDRLLSIRSGKLGSFVKSPWTRYHIDDSGFWPDADPRRTDRRAVPQVRAGMVDLTDVERVDLIDDTEPVPSWAVATFDVDGGVTGLRAAAKLLAHDGTGSDAAESDVPLPSLRSAGLMLIRHDRMHDFEDRAQLAAGRAGKDADDEFLNSDDLVLGYRVDILADGDGTWRSLCAREARYWVTTPDGHCTEIAAGRGRPEEGHVKHLAAVRDGDGVVRADEIVVRWDGWSLAVPPPPLAHQIGDPVDEPPRKSLPFSLHWEFAVPVGSLPRLRFGNRYRLRIRVADVAGGGPDVDAVTGAAGATNPIAYRRAEPVLPPRLHIEPSPLPGAAVDRLVIRSDREMTAREFVAAYPRYSAPEACTLYPPTASFPLIEQHGVLDDMTDEVSWALAERALVCSEDEEPDRALPDPSADGISAFVAPAPGGVDEDLWQAAPWGPWPTDRIKTITVSDDLDGAAPIRIEWDDAGDALRINLAQAEEAEVELSSTVRLDELHHFAVYEWLVESSRRRGAATSAAGVTADEARRGRHPMLSPAVRLHAVHAVKRPLVDPRWTVTAERTEGDTAADLMAGFPAGGLDTDSTGRIEVAASWEEWDDGTVTPVEAPHIHDQAIDRGDPPAVQCRHDFGDTKHRRVTYTLKAISRFREYFEADEPDEAFEAVASQPPSVIPSSALPPQPEVLAVVPAFRWSTETTATRIVRRRTGNRLIVELARPWYVTGAGECLAVLVSTTTPPGESSELLTQLAADPIYTTPTIDRFPDPRWFQAEAQPVTLRGNGLPAAAVAIPVTDAGDRWQADVGFRIPAGVVTYRPFVQLAVARYQPNSLQSLELSTVVTTERVSLLPDREIVISPSEQGLEIAVHGHNPEPANRVVVGLDQLAHPTSDPGDVDLIDLDGSLDSDVPAWRPLAGYTREGDASGRPILLPLPAGSPPLRLRVREVEHLLEPLGASATPAELAAETPTELTERTVLFDHIPIPSSWLPQ